MDHCRRLAPEIPSARLVYDPTDDVIAATVAAGHVAIHPWAPALTRERVDACHGAGLQVNTWTCNDPERLVELNAMGVDGVCTDVPDVARAALGRASDPIDLNPTWETPA